MITLPSGRFIYCMSLENMYFYPWRSGDGVSVTCCGYFTTHFKFHLPNCESFYLIDAPLAGKRVLIPLPNLSRKFMRTLLHEGRIVMCIHDLAVIWKRQHTESSGIKPATFHFHTTKMFWAVRVRAQPSTTKLNIRWSRSRNKRDNIVSICQICY